MNRLILSLAFLAFAGSAHAQNVTVIGPVTAGDLPQFNSTTVIKDSGIPSSGAGGYVIGTSPSVIGCAAPWANVTGTLLGNNCGLSISSGGFVSMIGSNTAAITADGAQTTIQNSATTAQSVYGGLVPGFLYDGLRSTVTVPFGTTANSANGLGCYVRDRAVSAGATGNAVCNFGIITAGVASAAVWATNIIVTDTEDNVHSFVATLSGIELDFSPYNTGSTVGGVTLLGSATAQPAGSTGFTVGTMSSQSPGTIKWGNAFVTNNGAATNAASFGATALSGSNVASQPVYFNGFDASAAAFGYSIQALNHALIFADNTLAHGVSITASATSPIIAPTGTGNSTLDLEALGSGSVFSNSPFRVNNSAQVSSLVIGAGSSITSSGAGGALGTNAFTSTAYAPIASPTFTGTQTLTTALATTLAIGGASIGSNALAVTGTASVSGNINTASGSYELGGVAIISPLAGAYTLINGLDGTPRAIFGAASTATNFRNTTGTVFQNDGGTVPYVTITTTGLQVNAVTTGTPASYACFDASNNLIKSSTAC